MKPIAVEETRDQRACVRAGVTPRRSPRRSTASAAWVHRASLLRDGGTYLRVSVRELTSTPGAIPLHLDSRTTPSSALSPVSCWSRRARPSTRSVSGRATIPMATATYLFEVSASSPTPMATPGSGTSPQVQPSALPLATPRAAISSLSTRVPSESSTVHVADHGAAAHTSARAFLGSLRGTCGRRSMYRSSPNRPTVNSVALAPASMRRRPTWPGRAYLCSGPIVCTRVAARRRCRARVTVLAAACRIAMSTR